MNSWYIEFFNADTHEYLFTVKIACEDDWGLVSEHELELEEEGINYYTLLKTFEDYC